MTYIDARIPHGNVICMSCVRASAAQAQLYCRQQCSNILCRFVFWRKFCILAEEIEQLLDTTLLQQDRLTQPDWGVQAR